jgi:hypothetical protein
MFNDKVRALNQSGKKELIQKNLVLEEDFKELQFQKFDDYWYFEDYAIKHKLRLIDTSDNNDQHLTQENNYLLADIIAKLFYSKTLNLI